MAYAMPPTNVQPMPQQSTHARCRYLVGLVRLKLECVTDAIWAKDCGNIIASSREFQIALKDLGRDLYRRGFGPWLEVGGDHPFFANKAKLASTALRLYEIQDPRERMKNFTFLMQRARKCNELFIEICSTKLSEKIYGDQDWFHARCNECIKTGQKFPVPEARDGQVEPPPNPFMKSAVFGHPAPCQENAPPQHSVAHQEAAVPQQSVQPQAIALPQHSVQPQAIAMPEYSLSSQALAVQQHSVPPQAMVVHQHSVPQQVIAVQQQVQHQAIALHQLPTHPQVLAVQQPSVQPQEIAVYQHPTPPQVFAVQYPSVQPQEIVVQHQAPAQVSVPQFSGPAQVAQVPVVGYSAPPQVAVVQNPPQVPVQEMASLSISSKPSKSTRGDYECKYAREVFGDLLFHIERLQGILVQKQLTKKQQNELISGMMFAFKNVKKILREKYKNDTLHVYNQKYKEFQEKITKMYNLETRLHIAWDAPDERNTQESVDYLLGLLNEIHNSFVWFCQNKWGDVLYSDQDWYEYCVNRPHRMPVVEGAQFQAEPPQPNPCSLCGNRLCFACAEQ